MPSKKNTSSSSHHPPIKTNRDLQQEQQDEIEALQSIYTSQVEAKLTKDKRSGETLNVIMLKVLPSQSIMESPYIMEEEDDDDEEEDNSVNESLLQQDSQMENGNSLYSPEDEQKPTDTSQEGHPTSGSSRPNLEVTLYIMLPKYYPLVKPHYDIRNFDESLFSQQDKSELLQLIEEKIEELIAYEDVMIFELYETCKAFLDEKLEAYQSIEDLRAGKSAYDEMNERIQMEERLQQEKKEKMKLEREHEAMILQQEYEREMMIHENEKKQQKRDKLREREKRRKAMTQERMSFDRFGPSTPLEIDTNLSSNTYAQDSTQISSQEQDSDSDYSPSSQRQRHQESVLREASGGKQQRGSLLSATLSAAGKQNSASKLKALHRSKSSGWFGIDDDDTSDEDDSSSSDDDDDDDSDETTSSDEDNTSDDGGFSRRRSAVKMDPTTAANAESLFAPEEGDLETPDSVSSSIPSSIGGGVGSPIWPSALLANYQQLQNSGAEFFPQSLPPAGASNIPSAENLDSSHKRQLFIVHLLKHFFKHANVDPKRESDTFEDCIHQLEGAGILNPSDVSLFCNSEQDLDTSPTSLQDESSPSTSSSSVTTSKFDHEKFNQMFSSTFQEQIKQPRGSLAAKLWTPISKNDSENNDASKSRYENDFEELCEVGRGGFGSVVKARNKLDSRIYAVKKVKFSGDISQQDEKKILREVNLLSHLHHDNIVRYYNAWRENVNNGELIDSESEESDSIDLDYVDEELDLSGVYDDESAMMRNRTANTKSALTTKNASKSTVPSRVMYITMEYCISTLQHELASESIHKKSKAQIWETIRSILEGLVYIHSRQIVHRDIKPANLFLDHQYNVKLGDFGLARKGVQRKGLNSAMDVLSLRSTDSKPELSHSRSQDLSTEVGTPIYCAPEIETSSSYDGRVDMYSLGIIFFELCMRRNGFFDSLHERADEIIKLRQTGKVPDKFPKSWQDCAKVIELLVQKDPQNRPTAQQLLESGLVPVSIQREELKKAFMRVKRDYATLVKELNTNKLFKKEKLLNRMRHIFQCHGAVQLDMSAIIPYSEQAISMQQQYRDQFSPLVFPSGNLVCTPHDLHTQYARFLSRLPTPPHFVKRYSFDQIYKESPEDDTARMKSLACFDIVGTKKFGVTDSEVLKVTLEILHSLVLKKSSQYHSRFAIRLNHAQIFRAVMNLCNIQEEDFPFVIDVLRNRRKFGFEWNKVTELLEKGNIPPPSIQQLRTLLFDDKESAIDVHRILMRQLGSHTANREALSEITTILGHFEIWKLGEVSLILDPLYCNKYYNRYTGLDFQVEILTRRTNHKKSETLGYGGRYDDLVNRFAVVPNSKTHAHVVGMCFKMERLLKLTQLNSDLMHPYSSLCFDTGKPDVLIASVGIGMLEERMRLANYLWSSGIKVDLVYDDQRIHPNYITQYCIEHEIEWVATTRNRLASKNMVKIMRISSDKQKRRKEAPSEMKIDEFVNLIKTEAASAASHGQGEASMSSAMVAGATGSNDSSLLTQDPEILKSIEFVSSSRLKSKQKRHIQMSVLGKFLDYSKHFYQKTQIVAVMDHVRTQEIYDLLQLFPSEQKFSDFMNSRSNKKQSSTFQSIWKCLKETQGQKRHICFYLVTETRFIFHHMS